MFKQHITKTLNRQDQKSSLQEEYVSVTPKVQPLTLAECKDALNIKESGSGLLLLGKQKGQSVGKLSLPPMIDNTINIAKTTIRYYVESSSGPVSCSVSDIFGALGGIALSTTSFRPWSGSFRILHVDAWPALSSTAGDAQVQMSWNSGLAGQNRDSIKSVDVPRGNTTTGRVRFTPPRKSLASDWVAGTASSTPNLFTIVGAPGSILDFHVQFTLANAFASALITISNGVSGTPCYLALDGAGSNTIIPAHLPTTN